MAKPSTKAKMSKKPDISKISEISHMAEDTRHAAYKSFIDQYYKAIQMDDPDPLNFQKLYQKIGQDLAAKPETIIEAQTELWQNMSQLWQNFASQMLGESVDPVIQPEKGDKRFGDESWTNHPYFSLIKQSYLLTSQYMMDMVKNANSLTPREEHQAEFFTQYFLDALSPSNFPETNPVVINKALETNGESLKQGYQNFMRDMADGQGQLKTKMADTDAFVVGGNVGRTPGKVIFENHLIQLIQYTPQTDKVHETPVLITPPWINKFYVLDLQEHNSYVNWIVQQGYTVFLISWVNPDESHADVTFEDYMNSGLLTALDKTLEETGQKNAHVVGYCVGGTLLAATLAYLDAKKDHRIKSATFLASLTDYADSGDLMAFIDKDLLDKLDQRMDKTGYLDAMSMQTTYNMLKPRDLIWSFYIQQYLMGDQPMEFDLLYWNMDSTNIAKTMHSYFLRNMYLENNLTKPGKLNLNKTPIDLGKIKTPSFFVSTQGDHITPWEKVYNSTQLFGGPTKFYMSGSGHLAGIVNHPDRKKYGYWENDKTPPSADDWFKNAKQHEGSWWPSWDKWLSSQSGKKIAARKPGAKLGTIENAPGKYVKVRAV